MKVLITGGHLTPAIALMQYLKHQGDSAVFIGRRLSSQSAQVKSYEKSEVNKLGFKFYQLPFDVKFDRYHPIKSILKLPLMIPLIIKSFQIIFQSKPQVMISFGGYLAVPVAISAWLQRIPIITHEQTTAAGLANRIIGKFASKIALSHPSSKQFFDPTKTIVTGNLIRRELIRNAVGKPSWVPRHHLKPILYITGGNQGSLIINHTIFALLDHLTQKYFVIHQTGHNKTQPAQKAKSKLMPAKSQHYYYQAWFDAQELSWILKNSYIVISRSGANTITELITTATPSVLIPLPGSQKSEQMKNAQRISRAQAGLIISQDKLNPNLLLQTLNQINASYPQFKNHALKISRHQNSHATENIYDLASELITS